MNISLLLNEIAKSHSYRYVLCDSTERLTYAMLMRRVDSVTWYLQAQGCGPGSRVVTVANGCQEYMEVLLACLQLGVQVIPLSVRTEPDALLETLKLLKPGVVFLGQEVARMLRGAPRETLPQGRTVVMGTCAPYVPYSRLTRRHDRFLSREIPSDTPVAGVVRDGVIVEQLTYGAAGDLLARYRRPTPEEGAVLLCVPYLTVFYIAEILVAVAKGLQLVLLKHVSAKNILKCVGKYHITETVMTPTLLRVIARDARFFSGNLRGVRVLRLGLAYLDTDVIAGIKQLFSPECVLRRTLDHNCRYTALELPVSSLESVGNILRMRVNSVGRAQPGVEICAMDGQGRPLPPGARGSLFARAADERTSRWMPLGKNGLVDQDGYVFLDYRSLPLSVDKPPCISKIVVGSGGGDEVYTHDYQIPLFICDEMLRDFSNASELPDVRSMLRQLSVSIIEHEKIDAIAIAFPMHTANMKLSTDEVTNELNGTAATPRLPQLFYVRSPDGIAEMTCGQPEFPDALTLLYYPLYASDGHLVGEAYMGLLGREELTQYERVQIHMVISHLSYCLSSFERRMQADMLLNLMQTALNLVDDGVGISDIGATPSLMYANTESQRLIGLGKEDPVFGELLEKIQTQNMYRLKYDSQEESSESYFYTDEQGQNAWVNYTARRVVVNGDEYAVCISNMRRNSLSVRHLEGLLSKQELAVLEQISAGLTNKEAAARLQISDNTVKYHLSHIYEKLGVKNRAELLAGTALRRNS